MTKYTLLLALALAACGSPKKSPDASGDPLKGTGQGQHDGDVIPAGEFSQRCNTAGGELSRDGTHCVVTTSPIIPDNVKTDVKGMVLLDPNFHNGKWLRLEGTPGAISVVLGSPETGYYMIEKYSANKLEENLDLPNKGSGQLKLRVYDDVHSATSVSIYECFNNQTVNGNGMYTVYCDAKYLP